MKKRIAVMILSCLILSGCEINDGMAVGESMSAIINRNKPFITLNELTVFQTDGSYIAVVAENGVIQKSVEFSSDRKGYNAQGLTLIEIEDLHQYIGKSVGELTTNLGEAHADVGCGFYIPAYFTEDACLVSFQLVDDTVFEVIKLDLLSNSVVERVIDE